MSGGVKGCEDRVLAETRTGVVALWCKGGRERESWSRSWAMASSSAVLWKGNERMNECMYMAHSPSEVGI